MSIKLCMLPWTCICVLYEINIVNIEGRISSPANDASCMRLCCVRRSSEPRRLLVYVYWAWHWPRENNTVCLSVTLQLVVLVQSRWQRDKRLHIVERWPPSISSHSLFEKLNGSCQISLRCHLVPENRVPEFVVCKCLINGANSESACNRVIGEMK